MVDGNIDGFEGEVVEADVTAANRRKGSTELGVSFLVIDEDLMAVEVLPS